MSIQASNQLSKNSRQESIEPISETVTAVEAAPEPLEIPQTIYDPDDEEWKDFNWEKYRKRAAKRLSALGDIEARSSAWRDDTGAQLWCARRLPAPVVRWITTDLPNRALWEHLSADEMKPLKYEALRGFQQAPGSLRREAVQKRMAAWLGQNPDEIHLLLLRWGLRQPQSPVLQAVEEQSEEEILIDRLPSLIRTFGANALGAALAFAGKPKAFQTLATIIENEAEWTEILENAPLYGAPKNDSEEASPTAATAPAPDSQAAHFWHEEARQSRDSFEQLSVRLNEVLAVAEREVGVRAKVKTLETEIADLKKRELKKAAQVAKKLEQAERKWAAKYDERDKAEAREARRVRALQNQLETLEADNKRHKRQVRQLAQLREEERRKVIALEAKLAELNGENADKPTSSKKPVDAVSSPPTTQDAPNRPIKVSKPSPLDEIFEWMAHGRRVRMTAREVRRLIDKNDEERVGTVMLELDALEDSNPELRAKFLERLSGVGNYYARVLTHSTTRVLVDASNVARFLNNRYGKGQLDHLKLMRRELQRLDCWPIIFVADASLPYNIDQPQELREMARQGEIVITDKGVEADEILAREARATGAYVVTNDAKFFYKVSPDYEPPRISFRVLDGLVVVDEF